MATDRTVNGNAVSGSETRYTPYGEVRPGGGGLPTDRFFTGYAREQAGYVGALDFAQARFYSPLLGRFVSADSIVQASADPQTLNRYSYSRSSPLRYTDPSGHFWKEALAILGGALLGGSLGLAAETLSQVGIEGLAVASGQKSVEQAIESFNTGENQASRIGATAGGATTGFLLGFQAAIGKSSGAATLALASVAGGQMEALAGGIAEEHIRNGSQFDLGNAGLRAVGRGLGDPITLVKDAGLGAATGLLSNSMGQFIDRAANRAFRPEIRQITDFNPVTGRPNLISLGKSNVVRLNPAQLSIVNVLKSGWDLITETGTRSVPDQESR